MSRFTDRDPLDGSMPSWIQKAAAAACALTLFALPALAEELFLNPIFEVERPPWFLVLADVDQDGHVDIIATYQYFDFISILYGGGDGTITHESRVDVTRAAGAGAGDFNGDGLIDIALAQQGLSLLLGREDGSFDVQSILPSVLAGARSVAVGDFDDDGNLDVAGGALSIHVMLGRGDGSFDGPDLYDAGGAPGFVIARDLNGDGIEDLASTNRANSFVSVLFGRGDGTFDSARLLGVGTTPVQITTADIDTDGSTDLAVPSYDSGQISVILATGTGWFHPEVRFEGGPYPMAITSGDFDADGAADLATAVQSGHVSALFGDGAGAFFPRVEFPAGTQPSGLTATDLNDDGASDVVATGGPGDVTVFQGSERWGLYG